MKLIVCLDDYGGMAFNRRRQTRDKKQREYLNRMIAGQKMWMHPYSGKLFVPDLPDVDCYVAEDYLQQAAGSDFVLCERELPDFGEGEPEEVIVFGWNRTYPGDLHFPLDLLDRMKKIREDHAAGSSHEDIRIEVYVK